MLETISRPYTFVKDGVFYFSRRIPQELRQQYTSPRIAYSLRTKSPKIAEARARRAADVAVLGASFWNIVLAITVTILPKFARVARAPTIALKEREFVEAARALGYSDLRIMAVHLAPNVLGEVIVLASLWAAYAIRIEAYLSFIGLGIAPPTPTLGTMIREGFEHILDSPFVSIYPGFAVLLVVLSLNLIGDGLRDAIDPKLRD